LVISRHRLGKATRRNTDFRNRSIARHQGDRRDADLAITQNLLSDARFRDNTAYPVTKAYAVKRGETQTTMDFSNRVPPLTPPEDKMH
jgi:hypothetical protein